MNIQTITNVADCVPLYLPHSLYLKPSAIFNISVSLPKIKSGEQISNFDIMDRLTTAIKPEKFLVLKVVESTVKFVHLNAELDNRIKLGTVLSRLDGMTFKLKNINESFKVSADEVINDFPTRHDWDSYFRDSKTMNEMKAGERPDTIHISNLPIRWFCPRHMENEENVKPSENIFKRIFEKFGSVRCIDIPICDPYRSKMKSDITGISSANIDQNVWFEGYVQFNEYVGFVRAMDEFRKMKLVRKCVDKHLAVNIAVTFDKTKHLCDANVSRRSVIRNRLIAKEKLKEAEELKKKKEEEKKLEEERKAQEQLKLKEQEELREREEKRKSKRLKEISEKGQFELTKKIRAEEKKLLIAQRKLESIRILELLFDRMKAKELLLKAPKTETNSKASERKNKSNSDDRINEKSNDMQSKIVAKYKKATEEVVERQKQHLEEVKNKTCLQELLHAENALGSEKKKKRKKKKKKLSRSNSEDSLTEEEQLEKKNENKILTPFNGVTPELAAEFLKMSMLQYVPPMFPAMPIFRPQYPIPMNLNYRGYMHPFRGGRSRGRGRGRGRGYFNGSSNNQYDKYDNNGSYKYKPSGNRNGNYRDDDYDDDSYHSYNEKRRSRSYSRSRSHSRSRSLSRSRSYSHKRSPSISSRSRSARSYSRSRSSRSRSKSRQSRNRSNNFKRKLCSTRRSQSASSERSRSMSKTRRRSWSKKSNPTNKVEINTDKLVRSAKEIQKAVREKLTQRLREEEDRKKNRPNLIARSIPDVNESKSDEKRSSSFDSSKFVSPKRKELSLTPE